MVAGDEDGLVGQGGDRAMPERRPLPRREALPPARRAEPRLPGDPAERDHHSDTVQQRQLPREPAPAALQLLPGGPVVGRRAAGRGGHVAVAELQSVIPADRVGLVGEPEAVQGLVQPVTAGVPREHPPGPVASVCGGGEPHDQKTGSMIPEPRHRSAPVGPVAELPLLLLRDQAAPGAEPRASLAGDDSVPGRSPAQCLSYGSG